LDFFVNSEVIFTKINSGINKIFIINRNTEDY
jgi:hypothetical protein